MFSMKSTLAVIGGAPPWMGWVIRDPTTKRRHTGYTAPNLGAQLCNQSSRVAWAHNGR